MLLINIPIQFYLNIHWKKHILKVTKKIKISTSQISFFAKAVTDQLQNRPIFRTQYWTQLQFSSLSYLAWVPLITGLRRHAGLCQNALLALTKFMFEDLAKKVTFNHQMLHIRQWRTATEFPSSLHLYLIAVWHWPNDFQFVYSYFFPTLGNKGSGCYFLCIPSPQNATSCLLFMFAILQL